MLLRRHITAVIWKDLLVEWRTREALTQGGVFALMMVFIFRVAFDFAGAALDTMSAGLLWTVVIFTGVVVLNRTFGVERDQGTLDGILLAPTDRAALYIGKVCSTTILLMTVEIIAIAVFVVLFNPEHLSAGLFVVMVIGTIGFAGVGTLFAAIAAVTRSRDVLLPILLLPAAVPILIPAVHVTDVLMHPRLGGDVAASLAILVAFTALVIALAILTFDYVFEE